MKTSAPGKLLLFGDHAAVYGYPCIVTAINWRLVVEPGEASGDTRFIDAAIRVWGTPGQQCHATSTFSGAYGFGSSSAVTVATLKWLRPSATNQELFAAAYDIVLKIQGAGSGFDVAAAVYGGTLRYVKNVTVEPLAIPSLPLVVGYTGAKADTATLIAQVAKKREKEPTKVRRIFESIAQLVEQSKTHLLSADWERVGTIMNFSQEYLRDLGVSSEKIESLIHAAKDAGAWGAKLSGAGGGDCVIALVSPEKKEKVEQAIKNAGGEIVQNIVTHGEGVRIDE